MLSRSALAGLAMLGLAAADAAAADIPAFYQVSDAELAGAPGTLIRSEPWPIESAYRASVFRILYRSTGANGEPIAVSGSVTIPDNIPAPSTGRGIVAWAHGTSGVVRKCAPSLRDVPYHSVPGLQDLLARGYVVVATDYQGLGAEGLHAYLSGENEARAVLDSVRAVRHLEQAQASAEYVVWGHSQGGHAALWTGQIARQYAAELTLHGIAAAAPATDLVRLFDADEASDAGRILTAMAIRSWSRAFGLPEDQIVNPGARHLMEKMAGDCIDITGEVLKALEIAGELTRGFLTADPSETSPWMEVMQRNSPGKARIGVPVFIAQGMQDTIVRPKVTVEYVKRLCGEGEHVTFREMEDVDHGKAARKAEGAAVDWMTARLAGQAVKNDCGG